MKSLQTLLLALVLLIAAPAASVASIPGTCVVADDNTNSVMTIKVAKIVKNEKDATRLAKQLRTVPGVVEVDACTTSGTVKISYNKAEMGCCSKLHSQLESKGWKYEMVSNEEKPACTKGAAKTCPSTCPGKTQKSQS